MESKPEEDEYENLLWNVACKRKRYPALCAKYLSKTLKYEIHQVKRTAVKLNDSRYSDDINWSIPEGVKEEITKSSQQINATNNLKRADDMLQRLRNLKRVLDQIHKEETCEIDIYAKKYRRDKNFQHRSHNSAAKENS